MSAQGTKSETNNQSWFSLIGWSTALCILVAMFALGLRLTEHVLSVPNAHAAVNTTYQATILSLNSPTKLSAGQSADVVVSIKNSGTSTWLSSGSNYVSLYRYNATQKIETTSLFSTPAWNTDKRVTLLPTDSIKPGQWVNFHVPIRAPQTNGTFSETFILAAENVAWMKGSLFTLSITVNGAGSVAAPAVQASAPAPAVTAPAPTPAPSATGWSAQLVEKPGTAWQIDRDDHVVVVLGYKNTGTQTWSNSSANYVSIYSVDGNNKERVSPFQDYKWLSPSHAIKMREDTVKPGEIGHFLLELRARLPGSYNETFALAAENTAWISGSAVTLPITVPLTGDFIATAPPGSDVLNTIPINQVRSAQAGDYAASLLLRSAQNLTLLGNGRQQLTFGFKNQGTQTWNSLGLRIKGIQPAIVGRLTSSVQDDSWLSAVEPVKSSAVTKPGEVGFITFKIKAPVKRGTYTASFASYADNHLIDGGDIDIPITVTADGYLDPNAPTQTPVTTPTPTPTTTPTPTPTNSNQPSINPVPLNGDASSLPNEPIIRVGLFRTTDDQMIIRARFAALTVTQNGTTICHVNTGESITIRYDRTNKVYKLSGGACGGQSSGYYVVGADDGISPMEVSDFTRLVSWLPGANDNTFRAKLELRYTPSTDSVWIINELPIEWYLKGIGETSNSSPQEYQRALLTAARTYAMYHVQRSTKHASEYFTVDATYDQVYRGYGAESRDPNVVAAVDATRSQIVTYNGQLAITPYYSRSDGRTRSWTEVWGGGPYPWLVSVSVPWDQGKTLWGHGVGLSATGALSMAADGWTYDRILKYFYTGIELRKAYK